MIPREYAKQNRHIGEAWEDGKTIQHLNDFDTWTDWSSPYRPQFNNTETRWRIKPEPPKPKFRAWKRDEVPPGCVIRLKADPTYWVVMTARLGDGIRCGILTPGGCETPFENISTNPEEYEYSVDFGKTWRPCGVEVAP